MDEDDYRGDRPMDDDPALAFEQLRGEVASTRSEVSLLRAAIEGLTAARESIDIPDYEPTLARTERILVALAQRVDPIAKSPALAMTPEHMASQIASAATIARREDQRLVAQARLALDQTTREIGNRLALARRGDEQNRWLMIACGCGVLSGLFLYALLAGPIARMAPAAWRWPERMATQALGEATQWNAGQRLMQSASLASWAAIVAADPLADGNRKVIQACRDAADEEKKTVRCND